MNPAAALLSSLKPHADAVLVFNESHPDPNFFYLTGFREGQFEGAGVLATKDKTTIFVPRLEEQLARRQVRAGTAIEVYGPGKPLNDILRKLAQGRKKIAINEKAASVQFLNYLRRELPAKKWVPAAKSLQSARLTKTPQEVQRITNAIRISEKAFQNLLQANAIRTGATEAHVAARLDYEMKLLGAQPAFPTIVAFGRNAAEPHHPVSQAQLKPNQLVLIDFGARYQQYCADITRTFIRGKASARQKRMHQVVLEAQQTGFDAMREVIFGSDVHSKVEQFINATEFKGKFIHSTGHSLGLEVHDGGGLGSEKLRLKTGMVMTVEPGVYVKGEGGVRIEDDVVVTRNGCRILTRLPRGLEKI